MFTRAKVESLIFWFGGFFFYFILWANELIYIPDVIRADPGSGAMMVGGGLLGGAMGQAFAPDAPNMPTGPNVVKTEIEPGVHTVRRRTADGQIVEETVYSPEKEKERQHREQMLDELWNTVGTTTEEQEQRYNETKQAYLQAFEQQVEPEFDRQRQQLQAQQVATGRATSSTGAEDRSRLREEQQRGFERAATQAELLKRDLQAQEDQRKMNQINMLEGGMRADQAARMQGYGIGQQNYAQELQMQQAQAQAKYQADLNKYQGMMQGAGTGAAIGGYFGGMYNQPDPGTVKALAATSNLSVPQTTPTGNYFNNSSKFRWNK